MMVLQVLERQKLLETADGMGGHHIGGNRQGADQKVGMVMIIVVVIMMTVIIGEVIMLLVIVFKSLQFAFAKFKKLILYICSAFYSLSAPEYPQ